MNDTPTSWTSIATAANAQPPRRRAGRIVALICGALVLMAAAAGSAYALASREQPHADAAPATSAAPSSAAPARSPLMDDPAAMQVCPTILQLSRQADGFIDTNRMEALGNEAKKSTDLSLVHTGGILVGAAQIARASKGRNGELQALFDMGNAAQDLATLCSKNGYS